MFRDVGAPFAARQGRWVGAKAGVLAMRPAALRGDDHADFDYFRITRP